MDNSITLQDLLNKLREYNPEEVEIVKKAYEYADTLHKGQMRQSGKKIFWRRLLLLWNWKNI